MVSPKLTILDVGHGQCAVLQDDRGVLVFDAGKGPGLSMYLEDNEIREIDAVVVSHADADHIAGLTSLLLNEDLEVRKIYVNSDSIKNTETWKGLRRAVADAMERGLRVHVGITTHTEAAEFHRESVTIEVLAPDPPLTMGGPGATDLSERRLTSNSLSVVVRIFHKAKPKAVLAGDLDGVGLQNLLERQATFPADLLVFPHHGGLPGAMDPEEFARKISRAVRPEMVVFSIGRGIHGTPRQAIIQGIKRILVNPRIACTQLSENCAGVVPDDKPGHLSPIFASGRHRRACCAGSIQITWQDGITTSMPERELHRSFIRRHAESALCA